MTAHVTQRLAVGAGILGIVGVLCLGAYVPAAIAASQKQAIEWSADLDCTATCHTRQVETLTDDGTQISAHHGGLPCTSCHTDIEGMAKGHEGVGADDTKGPKRLKKSEVNSDGCVACHQVTDGVVPADAWAAKQANATPIGAKEGADTAELTIPAYSATATVAIDYLVDVNGTVVNPHDLPVNKSHATLTCATCHTMHNNAPLEETATKACLKCHHDNVYECFTCHD